MISFFQHLALTPLDLLSAGRIVVVNSRLRALAFRSFVYGFGVALGGAVLLLSFAPSLTESIFGNLSGIWATFAFAGTVLSSIVLSALLAVIVTAIVACLDSEKLVPALAAHLGLPMPTPTMADQRSLIVRGLLLISIAGAWLTLLTVSVVVSFIPPLSAAAFLLSGLAISAGLFEIVLGALGIPFSRYPQLYRAHFAQLLALGVWLNALSFVPLLSLVIAPLAIIVLSREVLLSSGSAGQEARL